MSTQPGEPRRRFGKMEAAILIPNLVIIGGILFYLVATTIDEERVDPLVEADPDTAARISELEAALIDNPGDMSRAIELARIYTDMGEYPWSYNALKNAEARGNNDPAWQLKLGLAYLELGKNEDGLRVLTSALEDCGVTKCTHNTRVKLDLFSRVARIFVERKIDGRKDRVAADKAVKEVFKPVKADPEKMRLKAPVEPEEAVEGKPKELAPEPKKG